MNEIICKISNLIQHEGICIIKKLKSFFIVANERDFIHIHIE